MKTVHTVQSFLDTFCQNGLQFRIICAYKAVKGANRNCHSVITASWLNSPTPPPTRTLVMSSLLYPPLVCAPGGVVGAPFPDPPPLQGSCDGDPRWADGDLTGRRRRLGGPGGAVVLTCPNIHGSKGSPDALIILGYVSWGEFF